MKNKKWIIIPAAIVIFSGCTAQKKQVVKVHAYSQVIIPGIIPSAIDEGGNKIRAAYRPKKNYMIYVENLKNKPVLITDMWIDSLHYSVKTERVAATPVRKFRYNEYDKTDTILMVPATPHEVLLVLPGELSEQIIPGTMTINAGYPELTIAYTYKGKKYFARVEKLTVIPPDITQ